MMAVKRDPLGEYARKRKFADTPEPRGRPRDSSTTLRFVVQMHRASRLHYDFRLEAGGVLASWAIPKGPTRNPSEKRLAMHVEDHPYAYRTFEGTIPAGNYGAGEVIVWDEGTYALAEGSDPVAEIGAGKIKFVMHGKKLRGMFTLVRIKNRSDESGEPWLLIKDHDEFADPGWEPTDQPASVTSGHTLAEIKQTASVQKTWTSGKRAIAPSTRKTVRSDVVPRDPAPMLATLIDAPFDDSAWLFEIKWDGYRAIATIDAEGALTLASRTGKNLLARFPQLDSIGAAFRSRPIVVDGEICVLDEQGRSSFQNLQSAEKRGARAVTFVAFDCLYADGRDLRTEPLDERKARLESLILDGHGVMYSKHTIGTGTALFTLAQREGLEGIIGKLRVSPYRAARSREWVKIKAKRRQEFVVGGWTEPKGSRRGFGALLVGYYRAGALIFAGSVGTGFDAATLADLTKTFAPLARKTSPFTNDIEANSPAHFVKPLLVAEVAFAEWTHEGRLRQPVYLGLREDKPAADVVREDLAD